MLSDEEREIFNNLKDYMQNKIDNGYHKFIYNDLDWDFKCIDCINAIDNALKQSKKIEELKEQNLIQRKQLNDAFDRGWIHKNTIEAGIKEIKNRKGDPLIRGAKIRALQSLLKKGNDADVR